MFGRLLRTDDSTALLCIRLILGLVFFVHGSQKMLGWFGGMGFASYMHYLIAVRAIPGPLAFLCIAAEFFGALGLLAGCLSRIAAMGIAADMIVAIALVHAHFGFFMNWNGTQRGEGYEFHLLVIAMAAAVMIEGAGRFSIDRWLWDLTARWRGMDDGEIRNAA